MKKTLFLLIFGLFLTVSAHAQVAQPDCLLTSTFTMAGRGVYDNRGLASPVCTVWHLMYYTEGFSALSLELDGAPSVVGAPGTWAVWPTASLPSVTLPLTTTGRGQVTAFSYFPWVSINLTSVTGAGTVRAVLYGYRVNSASDVNSAPIATPIVATDPCQSPTIVKSHTFQNITTATTTTIVPISGTTTVYICQVDWEIANTGGAATTVFFKEGTGAACATAPVSLTATYSYIGANGTTGQTFHIGNGSATSFKSDPGNAICATTVVGTGPSIPIDVEYVQQ